MKEIGSEFMQGSYVKGTNEYKSLCDYPKRYVLSGRTGLYLIANELQNAGITSVALPAYCCSSMVAPFLDAGFQIVFYKAEEMLNAQAVLIMDYFGFIRSDTIKYAKKCKKVGKKVIIDATQTAFSRSEIFEYADYIVASYRKWFDCLCASVYSKNDFSTQEYQKEAKKYTLTWREAAKEKKKYLESVAGDKQNFLNLYSKANLMLAQDYIGFKASKKEIDHFEKLNSYSLRKARRENAEILISKLNGKVELLFNKLEDDDCPLFVPIILEKKLRSVIQTDMISNDIYCPVHWPVVEDYPYQKTALYDTELSLICDQRYSQNDIKREADLLIRSIEKRKKQ